MNKRYIDFVPANRKSELSVGRVPRQTVKTRPQTTMVRRMTMTRTTVAQVEAPISAPTPTSMPAPAPVRVSAPAPASTQTPASVTRRPIESTPKLGVIEDLNTNFVKTDVPKRPLSQGPVPTALEAKQKKVKAKGLPSSAKVAPRAMSAKPTKGQSAESATYKTPKSPFINQNKVIKRPLSGNVYKKQIAEAVKEEPKGPVTIITKPEKDRHIGVVVTVIITIILGAAAGTVAFLLLPK